MDQDPTPYGSRPIANSVYPRRERGSVGLATQTRSVLASCHQGLAQLADADSPSATPRPLDLPGRPFRTSSPCQPNTRDKLRGAHDPTMVLQHHDTVATAAYHAPLRLQPPLVSFIALFGRV